MIDKGHFWALFYENFSYTIRIQSSENKHNKPTGFTSFPGAQQTQIR